MTIHSIGDELVGNTAVANDHAASAQGISVFLPGADFVVNTTTARDQAQPSIAGLDDGHFVVTWLADQGGPQYDVHGQVFNQDGSIAGGEFIVSSPTANSASGPSTAGLGDGLFVVTWYSKVGDSAHTDILGRVFNVDGTPAGEEFIVNTTTDGSQHEPSVASLGDGRFVVTWASPDDDLGIIVRGRLFNADGSGGASGDAYRNFELERPPVPGGPSLAWRDRPSVGQRARRDDLAWSEGRIQRIGFEKGDQMRQCVNWAVQCVGADAVFDHLAIFAERDCDFW